MTTPLDNLVPLTGNALIDGLTWGAAWQFADGAHTLSYSLSLNDTVGNQPPWTVELSDAVRRALTEWSNVANLAFVEIGGGEVYNQSSADLAFLLTGNEMQTQIAGLIGLGLPPSPSLADSILGGASRAEYPQPEGDVALDNYYSGFSYLDSGGVGLTIMLHEIGHALGLKHTDDSHDGRPTFAGLGISDLDSQLYTVMSYTDALSQPLGSNQYQGNAATPMPLDILAMQQIYGANTSFHTGDDTYIIDPSGTSPSVRTVWDAGGSDTLAVRVGSTGPATIDLRDGQYSSVGGYQLAVAYNVTIENAAGGSGNDVLVGNDADNRLDGGLGDDSMSGGSGDDTYVVDSNQDVVAENPGEGNDTVRSSLSHALPVFVENLTLTGSASAVGRGNELNNILVANSGFDILQGGDGNDSYVIDNASTVENCALALWGEPGEFITGGGSYVFTDQNVDLNGWDDFTHDGIVDRMWFGGWGSGHYIDVEFRTYLLGENLAPGTYLDTRDPFLFLAGHPGLEVRCDGRDLLDTFGSFTVNDIAVDYSGAYPLVQRFSATFELHTGSPTGPVLTGEVHFDRSSLSIASSVIERSNEGTDEILSAISYVLPDNVENLTLTGSAAIAGTGNTLDNVIIGNAGDNSLHGAGGYDTLVGGAGNDDIILSLEGAVNGGVIDGGDGNDTITLQGPGWANLSSLDITLDQANGTISGPGFSFSVTNVEHLSISTGGALSIANWHISVPGSLIVEAGNITIGDGSTLAAGQNQVITTSGDITITGGSLSAGQGQTLMAGGSITVGGTGAVLLVSSPTSSVTLTSGNLALNGQLDIYSDYSSSSVTLSAGSIVGTNDVSVTASNGGSLVLSNLDGFVGPQLVTLDGSLVGTSYADKLIGYASSDIVVGGTGNDTIDGGTGLDTAHYSGARDDYTIVQSAWYHYTITDNNPADGDDGVDAVFGIERLQFADSMEALQTSNSWHGINHRPITPFWAHTDWQVLDSQRDFDGNGKNDLLLHKPDGSVALWLMDGAERLAGAIFDPVPGRSLIAASIDYNGDGRTDLGWREADGSNSYWLMGSGWVTSATVPPVTPPDTPPTEPPPPPPDGWWF